MATPDNKQKLLDLFAGIVEIHRPDVKQALSTPTRELSAGLDQGTSLIGGLVRPNPDEVDARAAGRQRFPALQGVASLLAEGLARNADLIAEVFTTPDDLAGAVALDQALGRLVFAGELLSLGGQTGELLAGTAAQRLCRDVLTEARARIDDPAAPPQIVSDVTVAFAEAFRLEEDNRQRPKQAQAQGAADAQPYLGAIGKAQAETEITGAVDAFLSSLQTEGAKP